VISTLIVVTIPFIFLLVFSELTHIAGTLLFQDLSFSFVRLVIAYIFAILFGWLFAVLFYKGKRALIALPLFDVLQSFPTFAALPLATYVWGVSNFTVIFFLIITIIWPVFFSIISSLKLIKHDWEAAVQIMRLAPLDYLRYYLIPITIPGIITGSIIGLGEGWEALIATEIIVGLKSGLGSFFQSYSKDVPITLFGILGFLILIFSINKLLWLPLLEWSHRELEE